MLILPGNPEFVAGRLTRRRWLEVGGAGALGLGLSDVLSSRATSAESLRRGPSFGRAKSCIVLFLFGAPAHQDTFDLKPQAPAEIRGEFQPIATRTPGLQVAEHLPRMASCSDRYALIRSVTHPDNTHTVAMHYMLTGVRHKRPSTNPQNAADDFPCFGAMVNYLEDRGLWTRASRQGALRGTSVRAEQGLPSAVSLNAPANQVSANNHIFPGFFAGLLGAGYDPVMVSRAPQLPDFRPFAIVETPARMIARQALSTALRQARQELDAAAAVRRFDDQQTQAAALLTSDAVQQAFALDAEPAASRERYGMTPFGQGCLLSRRLVERGVPLVTVNWERDDAYWDTHKNNFVDLKQKLLPNFDRGCSALLDDLAARGMLDDTLVVCLGEFGRTPKINKAAGRDHWAPCNTVLLAGAGLDGGRVYGASDRDAAYPAQHPVTPEDLAATIYHLLGIDPELRVRDATGRPMSVSLGTPVWPLLS